MRWLPLESNPEVMNEWSSGSVYLVLSSDPWRKRIGGQAKRIPLGLSTELVSFTDIYGLDEELLAMIPTPVSAVVMLFPITEKYESFRAEEHARVSKERAGQDPDELKKQDDSVLFIKQTISNACGTMGLLHALANNPNLPITPGPLKSLIERLRDKTPLERAKVIEEDKELAEVHTKTAQTGQSRVPRLEEDLTLHFVCFVKSPVTGRLVELDGRKEFPIDHGHVEGGLLHAVVPVIRKFITLAANDIQFNLIALCPTSNQS